MKQFSIFASILFLLTIVGCLGCGSDADPRIISTSKLSVSGLGSFIDAMTTNSVKATVTVKVINDGKKGDVRIKGLVTQGEEEFKDEKVITLNKNQSKEVKLEFTLSTEKDAPEPILKSCDAEGI